MISISKRSKESVLTKTLYLPTRFKEPINKLREASKATGLKIYLVGGLLRDLLLGFPVQNDIDVLVDYPKGDILLAKYLTKKYPSSKHVERLNTKFPVAMVILDGTSVQMSTPKSIEKTTSNIFIKGGTVKQDARRRDFGIDSLFYNLSNDSLVDLGGQGLEDINSRTVKLQGDPETIFSLDPRTLLKAIRLATTRKLQLDPSLEKNIKKYNYLLHLLKPGQVHKELDQILYSPNSLYGLALLRQTGILSYLTKNSSDLKIDPLTLDADSPVHKPLSARYAQTSTTPYYKTICPDSGKEVYFSPSDLIQDGGKVKCPEGKVKPKNIQPASLSKKLKLKKRKRNFSRRSCVECYEYGLKNGLSSREMKDYFSTAHPKPQFRPFTEQELQEINYPKYDISHKGYVTYDDASEMNYNNNMGDIRQTVESI